MHHHSLLFSAICKCAYVVAEDDPNQPQNKNQCLPDTIAGGAATTTTAALSSDQRRDKPQPQTKVPFTISRKSQDNHSTKSSDRASSPSKLVIKKGKLKRRVTIASSKQSKSSDISTVDNSGAGGGGGQESDWPPFADEDYIVFCFEEDGEFHVVTDDCSRSQSIDHIQSPRISNSSQKVHDDNEGHSSSPSSYGHDYVITNLLVSSNRRDYLLPNKAVEEERFYFSPRLQSDGIKSSTRFKDEGGYEEEDEEIDMVKARNRVEEDMECEEDIMDGIKHRGEINDEQEADDEADDNMEDLEEDHLDCRGLSMDCHNGSVESNGSSRQSDTHRYKSTTDQAIIISRSDLIYSSPPLDFHRIFEPSSMDDNNNIAIRRDGLLPNHDMIEEEEESVYLSSESQQNGSRQSYEEGFCSNNDDDDESRPESTHETTDSSETGDTDADRMDKDYEEITVLSIASSRSDSTTSSFEFPVLQVEWIGSPVTWPRSATVRYRKQKSPRVSLRCCKF